MIYMNSANSYSSIMLFLEKVLNITKNIRKVISVLWYVTVSPDPRRGSITILLKIGSKFFTKLFKRRRN